MGFRTQSIAVVAGVVLLLAAAGAGLAAGGGEVAIKDYAFAPPALVIAAGQAVTWTNADDSPHQVVAEDKRFRSPALDTGDRFTLTFAKAGTYRYFCSLHPQMVGTVTVH